MTKAALAEAEYYAEFIRSRSHDSVASDNWWNGLLTALLSLESLPNRCPHIPEQAEFDIKLHQLVYESHRIIFQVNPKQVKVFRIYHGEQKPLTPARLRRFARPAKHA
jgi:hypothetical protein